MNMMRLLIQRHRSKSGSLIFHCHNKAERVRRKLTEMKGRITIMNKWYAHQKNIDNSNINLICFSYAGGSASYFAPWGRCLPEGFGMIPILYPMRELRSGEDMPETAEELAAQIVGEAREIFEKPFIIYGHCTGAVIAYETACLLKKECGLTAELFVASSEPSPRMTKINPMTLEMSDEEFIEYAISLKLLDRTMTENKDFMDYYFSCFKSDFLLHQRYDPAGKETPLECPVIALRGNDDILSNDEIIIDWKNYTDDFTFRKFDGEHFFINQHSAEIIELIAEKYTSLHS